MAADEGENESPLSWRELIAIWLENDTVKFAGIVIVLATMWVGREFAYLPLH